MSDQTRARLAAIRELVLVRFRTFFREPGTMFWTFGFPLVVTVVLGIAFRNRTAEPVIVAVESGPNVDVALARRAEEALAKTPDVKVLQLSHEASELALRTGKVSLVVAPAEGGYAYRFDPTRPESRLARAVTDDALQRSAGRGDAFKPAERVVTEPGSRYIDFLVPGLLGLGMMSSGFWGIGFALAEMRTRKLLKRLIATPMRRSDFLFSFLLVRALLLLVELPPLLLFSHYVFDVGVRGSLVTLGIVAVAGALTFAVFGLFLACRAENAQIVSGLINVASFPMFLCSGVFFSSSRFPDAVQPVIKVMPLTALNDALRAVMIDGESLTAISGKLAILGVWGGVSFVLALRFFKWR